MAGRRLSAIEISLLVIFLASPYLSAQQQLVSSPAYGVTTMVQPAWQPVNGQSQMPIVHSITTFKGNPQIGVSPQTGGVGFVGGNQAGRSGWPYYVDSTLPNPSMIGGWPGMPQNAFGTAIVSAPINASPTSIRPIVSSLPAPIIVPQQQPVAPLVVPQPTASPVVAAMPQVPAATAPVAQTAPPPREPFVDKNVFLPAGQSWQEWDITSYTARFPPTINSEQGIREWIMHETDRSAWNGTQVASLVVSPQRVLVYHDPAVQARVGDLLGRFLYYSPGLFHARVRILNVRDLRWRGKYRDRLESIDTNQPGREAWLVSFADAQRITADLSTGQKGTLLSRPDPVIPNGQQARIHWAKEKSYKRDVSLVSSVGHRTRIESTEEGVELKLSPLVAPDAASIDLLVDLNAKKLNTERVKLLIPGKPKVEVPELTTATFQQTVRLPPGKNLLISLGLLPTFDTRWHLFGNNRTAEILVLIEIAPDKGNTVTAGGPPAMAQAAPTVYR